MNNKGEDIYDIRGKLAVACKAIKALDEAIDKDNYFFSYGMNADMVDDLAAAVRVCDELDTTVNALYPLPLDSNNNNLVTM